ncbi:hypothetical protein CcaverHIS631_0702240 [Cutaneotrichosporon cavernicola]|nr:hypothetical protein CcaverHIS631_0702240 [Cutaneotrichosporon cavernicola]
MDPKWFEMVNNNADISIRREAERVLPEINRFLHMINNPDFQKELATIDDCDLLLQHCRWADHNVWWMQGFIDKLVAGSKATNVPLDHGQLNVIGHFTAAIRVNALLANKFRKAVEKHREDPASDESKRLLQYSLLQFRVRLFSDDTDDSGDDSDSEDSLTDFEDSDSSDEYILPKATSRSQRHLPRSHSGHSTRANPRFPHDDGRDGFESTHNLKSGDDSRTHDNSKSQLSSSSSSSSSSEDEDKDINYRPPYYVKRRKPAHLRSSPRLQGRFDPVSEERDELDSIKEEEEEEEEEDIVVDVKPENELRHSVEEDEPSNAVNENELGYVVDENQLDYVVKMEDELDYVMAENHIHYVVKMEDEPERTVEEEELGRARKEEEELGRARKEDEVNNDAEPLGFTIKKEPGEPGDDIASAYHNPERASADRCWPHRDPGNWSQDRGYSSSAGIKHYRP